MRSRRSWNARFSTCVVWSTSCLTCLVSSAAGSPCASSRSTWPSWSSSAAASARPAMVERGHELIVSIEGRPLWALADPTRIEQVVVNLLHNAAKYTPDGGRIILSAGPDPEEPSRVAIAVADDGVGLSAELRERVFDLFTQADRSLDRQQGGLGIGLTLVRRLVELHGGSASVESDGQGKGSTFTVRLPGIEAPAPSSAPAATSRSPGPKSGRILIVDDNRDMVQSLAILLRGEGFQVHLAHDGPAGLEAVTRFGPDAVVLDLGLPGLDGFEVARRLRSGSPPFRGPLIAMSGYGREAEKQRAIAAGFDLHLTKPVATEELAEILQERIASPTPAPDRSQAPAPEPPEPTSPPEPSSPILTGTPVQESDGQGLSILLVEDQRSLAAVASRLLQRMGYRVEAVADGPSAIEAAHRLKPDAILCDLQLDGPMDGLDVARTLRAEPDFASTPMIALTARDGDQVRRDCLRSGFNLQLTKPIDFTQIDRHIEHVRGG